MKAQHASVAEWVVLRTLSTRGVTTPAELADMFGLTRGAVSKILDKLEAKQWTTRSTKPEDNRVQLLALTAQGCHVLPQLAVIADDNDARAFGCLDTEEKAILLRLLEKLAAFHQIREVPME